MGVSANHKVKFFSQQNEQKCEINIHGEAGALDSLLQTSGMNNITIRYINVNIDRESILTEEENKILFLNNTEEEMMETEILDAKKAFEVLEKLYFQIELKSRKVQSNQLKEIETMEISDEDKELKRIRINMEHTYFNHSYSKLLGVLATAAELNYKISIVVYYY